MTQQIEHLPVMQMKAGTPLPPNVDWNEVAWITHQFTYGRTSRDVRELHPVLGRNEKGDIYYAWKPVGQGQSELIGCISAGHIKNMKLLLN